MYVPVGDGYSLPSCESLEASLREAVATLFCVKEVDCYALVILFHVLLKLIATCT